MNDNFDKILKKLESYSELNQRERRSLQNELLEFASSNSDRFKSIVSNITPSEESVLFEIYESLSIQPEKWSDLIIDEFDRIETLTATAKSKFKDSISSPLVAISFFARQEFSGNEKLTTRIKKGVSSDSTQIVKISLDLLADIYLIDKTKYVTCKQTIEKQVNSKTIEIRQFAKLILNDLDNPAPQKKKLKLYSAYSFVIFIGGLYLSVMSVANYNKTFMKFSVIAVTFLIAGFLTWILHKSITSKAIVKKSETFAIGLGYGFIACFLLLFINLYSPNLNAHQEKHIIIDRGTLAKGRYSKCRQPYVKIERDQEIKKITFGCDDQYLVESAESIYLTIKKGLLGFDVIIDKKL